MSVLTLDYRPVRFQDVVGQSHVKPILRAMVKKGDVPPALIFGGTRGTGKTTSARILAAALNCEKQDEGDACGMCPSCLSVQKTNSTSVLEVDAASNGGVEEVRRIRDMCSYAHAGDWRVVLLDEAHSMSREAFNALLKLLEEPPPGTLFVLLTTEANRILETVRSRSMYFEFRRITTPEITGRLRKIAEAEEISAEEGMLELIARRSQGGMRDAVMALDMARRADVSTVAAYRETFAAYESAVPLMAAAVKGDYEIGARLIEETFARTGDAAEMAGDLTLLARDLIVVKAGGELQDLSEPDRVVRQTLAAKLPRERMGAVMRLLWELKTRTRATQDDQLATMHAAFVLLTEAIHPPTMRVPQAVAQHNGHNGSSQQVAASPRLSLEDMKRVVGTRSH